MHIDQWIGEETTVQDTPLHTALFYEKSTGYIYCPISMDDSSLVMATYVAIVDDFGNVQPTAPNRAYRLQKEWKGYSINQPITFCCNLAYKANRELSDIIDKQTSLVKEYQAAITRREEYLKLVNIEVGDLRDQLHDCNQIIDQQNATIKELTKKLQDQETEARLA